MKEVIDSALGLVQAILMAGLIYGGGACLFDTVYAEVRKAAVEALKRPTPSMERFTKKLSHP